MKFVKLYRIEPEDTKKLIGFDMSQSEYSRLELNEEMTKQFLNESSSFPEALDSTTSFYNLYTKSGQVYIIPGTRESILESFSTSNDKRQLLKG